MRVIKVKIFEKVPQNHTGIVEHFNGTKEWWINGRYIISLPSESQPFIFLEEFLNEEGKHQIKVLNQKGIEIWPNLPGLKECADNWEKE